MILVSRPLINICVRDLISILEEENLLSYFYTAFFWGSRWRINRIIPAYLMRELKRRSIPHKNNIESKLRVYPYYEIMRILISRLGVYCYYPFNKTFSEYTVFEKHDRWVSRSIKKLNTIKAVYGYEDSSLYTFVAAKENGISSIYEMQLGYWLKGKEIFEEEKKINYEWPIYLDNFYNNRIIERKEKELELADFIVAPSNFVKDSIIKYHPDFDKKIEIIYYPAPLNYSIPNFGRKGKRLKILFIGELTQRKGISYLFKAVNKFRDYVELTLVGRKPCGKWKLLERELRKHTWIRSLPLPILMDFMNNFDIFIMPSLFEGCNLSVLGAMARGLAVIVSKHSGVAELIKDKEEGFVIPIRSSESIEEKIELFLSNPSQLEMMKEKAYFKSQKISLPYYRSCISRIIKNWLCVD